VIVAWHEVPGRTSPKKVRPVGYGVILAGVRTNPIENVFGLTWAASLSRMDDPYGIS
jgi:hypothetical protein